MSADCVEAYTAFWPINEIWRLYSDECLTSPQGSWLLPYINLLMDFPPSKLAEFPLDGPPQLQGSFVHILQIDRIDHRGKRKAISISV